MAVPVFCNACFQNPQGAAPSFSLTNCGHVICERCLQKGKKDECVICRAPCRTIVLSEKMDSDIQSLFMGIDGLCRKYSKEVTQIAQFQEKNRKHLLAYYKGKIAELEGSLKKATQQMQHIQQLQPMQRTTQIPDSISIKNQVSVPSEKQNGHSLCSSHRRCLLTSETKVLSMEVDHVSGRKTETATRPIRFSLISPPRNGRMGTVSYRSSQLSGMTSCQNGTPGSVRLTPLRKPVTRTSYVSPLDSSQSNNISLPDSSGLRSSQDFQYTPRLLHSSATREPISLASLLQRQHLGYRAF